MCSEQLKHRSKKEKQNNKHEKLLAVRQKLYPKKKLNKTK